MARDNLTLLRHDPIVTESSLRKVFRQIIDEIEKCGDDKFYGDMQITFQANMPLSLKVARTRKVEDLSG